MKVRYDPRARDELIKAAEFFESQEQGLGNRFLLEIDKAIRETAASPLIWPIDKFKTRKRILISPFPYSIRYKIVQREIVIVAIAHQSREPDYWRDRLE